MVGSEYRWDTVEIKLGDIEGTVRIYEACPMKYNSLLPNHPVCALISHVGPVRNRD